MKTPLTNKKNEFKYVTVNLAWQIPRRFARATTPQKPNRSRSSAHEVFKGGGCFRRESSGLKRDGVVWGGGVMARIDLVPSSTKLCTVR